METFEKRSKISNGNGEKMNTRILMVDRQATKLADPLMVLLEPADEKHRYSLKSCQSYQEAISMLDEVDLALVELDLTREYFVPGDSEFLPWIHEDNAGYRLFLHLKNIYPAVKVIFIVDSSACDDFQSTKAEMMKKGADGYLIKPFAMSELVEKIRNL